jgi:RIO-like serine/threonine protein kinase
LTTRILKRDLFGTIAVVDMLASSTAAPFVVRDTREARVWLRWLARRLARREAHALKELNNVVGVPRLLEQTRDVLKREWIEGEPMQRARPTNPVYFRHASRLLRALHSRDVVHNDLAKETNWLVTTSGEPALVDFQLALRSRRRGRLFRMLAHDDIRHLLKHKRTYIPQLLTARERAILARPSILSRVWRATGKRVYLLITRRLLGWSDREGASDRAHGER